MSESAPARALRARSPSAVTLAIAALSLAAFALSWGQDLGGGGIAAVGAERVLHGEVPYRDFWTMYAPGHFYLLAALFAVFGTQLLVSNVAASVLFATAAGLAHRLALVLGARPVEAAACAGVFTASVLATGYHRFLGSYPPAVVGIVTVLLLLERHLRTGRPGPLLGAGLACGVTAVFKHDVGAYSAAAAGAGVLAHALCARGLRAGLRAAWGPLARLAAAAALPVLLVVALLAPLGGREMLDALIVWPATDFREARPEAYPSLLPTGLYDPAQLKRQLIYNVGRYLAFTLPFAAWLGGVLAAVAAWRARRPRDAALGVALAVGFAGHYAAAHVQINTHLMSLSLYGVCLAVLLRRALERAVPAPHGALLRALAVLVFAAWLGALASGPAGDLLTRTRARTPLGLAKLAGVRQSPAGASRTREVVRFVRERVPPGEFVYVGAHRHDVVLISDPLLYFVLDRPSATRFHELHPGLADTEPVQREIIAELRARDVRLVVLRRHFPDAVLDRVKRDMRRRLPAVGATALDAYLRDAFVEVASFGYYTVMERRDSV